MSKTYELITATKAEEYGFIIEGNLALLFDLGCTTAILGYNTLNGVWQFDTATDSTTGDTWQMVDVDFDRIVAKAEALAAMVRDYTEFMKHEGVHPEDVDFISLLDAAFEGCLGVNPK